MAAKAENKLMAENKSFVFVRAKLPLKPKVFSVSARAIWHKIKSYFVPKHFFDLKGGKR